MGIIYGWAHESKIVYVGRTVKSLYARSSQHIKEYQKQVRKGYQLTKKFKMVSKLKGEWDEIQFVQIEEIDDDKLGERERYWYNHYSTDNELWNSNLPPLVINYSDPVDIKDKMLNEFVKYQRSKISGMMTNLRDLLTLSWDYFCDNIGTLKVSEDKWIENPNYNDEELDFDATAINYLNECKTNPYFSVLLEEVVRFYRVNQSVNVDRIIKHFDYKKNYESLESVMDESISNGDWYYGKKLKEEPLDKDIFKRFDIEFQSIIKDLSPIHNSYDSNPHWRYYQPEFVKNGTQWKYQDGDIIQLEYKGLSDFNHEYIFQFDKLIRTFSKSDNFYKLMTYLRGKNAGKMTKHDKIHNRIQTEYYDQFDDSIREAIFNKHYYKYDNHHHETYLKVVKMIEIHMKVNNINPEEFEFKDDIYKPTINIHKYMVIKGA